MFLGGLDVGTTGCKLSVYDDRGSFVANEYAAYEVSRQSGEHEIDAGEIFDAVCSVIKKAALQYPLSSIGVTTFGETFVALDEDDRALLPAMLYTDPRGKEECEKLCSVIDEKTITHISGVQPHPMYSLPKIMWIKNNLPDVFKKTKRIMLMQDYIVYKLSGKACIDYSLAARTMAFDIRTRCWSDEILNAADVDKSLLSVPVAAGNIAGSLTKDMKERLGIDFDIKIINGCHDQVAAAVGCGVLEKGEAVDGTGTVECITPVFDEIPECDSLYRDGYAVVPYVLENTYVCYAFSFTGGAAVKWYRDNFKKDTEYSDLDKNVSKAPTGILVMPHFAGAATPYMDNGSKAAVIGLTLEHTAEDFYKAIMEGVTYEMMLNIERLENAGIKPDMLYATGGGAYSDVWLQIKADVLNRPVTSLLSKEAGNCGTCMLSAVALGIYSDLKEAKGVFVKANKTFTPDPERARKYAKYYQAYKKIYENIRPLVGEINMEEIC